MIKILHRMCGVLAGLLALTQVAFANLPLQVTDIVAGDGQAEPVVVAVTVPALAEYRVSLTDFGVAGSAVPPATGVSFVLVSDADASTLLTATQAGDVSGNVAAGSYRALLAVVPDATAGRASIGLRLEPVAGGAALIDRVDVFSTLEPAANPTALDLEFTIPANGDYTFELTDLAFPDILSGLQAIAIRRSDSSVLGTVAGSGSITLNGLVANELIGVSVVATRDDVSARSIVGYRLAGAGGGAVVDSALVELGDFSEVRSVDVPASPTGTPLTLTVTNFGALADLVVAAIDPATNQATVQAGNGSVPLAGTGAAQTLRIAAAAGATGGVGVRVSDAASATVFEDVVALEPAATVDGFAIVESSFTVAADGDITVNVRDFAFPQSFASVDVAVVRDGAIVASNGAFGSFTFAATTGDYFVTAIAQTTNPADSGLIGVAITDAAGASLLETSAAAGGDIRRFDVAVTGPARAVVVLTDLDFPAAFTQLSAVVTQGTDLVGTLLGGGTFEFDVVPGTYQLNVIARPSPVAGFSAFAATVDEQAPQPTVSLATSATSVPTGNSVTLTWSSTDATSCTASGAWVGSRDTSGTETITNVTANRTFTLTCDGPGGTDAVSVNVSVTAAQSVSGGGGPMSPWWLLASVALLARRPRR